jgi:lauroyl-KDO2-lipid IV(A) myristoyltransferase
VGQLAGLGLLCLLALVPHGHATGWPTVWPPLLRISRKQAYIAETNLKICFPELDEAGRQALLLKSIRVGLKTFMGFGELTWRSPTSSRGASR